MKAKTPKPAPVSPYERREQQRKEFNERLEREKKGRK
jgi:hypothetical protein